MTSRRQFLRHAAATIALPLLPSMLPRTAWADDSPLSPIRLLFFYVPNGMMMNNWTPSTEGAGYDLPTILEPLAPIQQHVSVLTGLDNEPAIVPVAGDHARGTGSFLTCATVNHTAGADIYNGISVDQVAAQAIGDQTAFRSLELGLEGGSSTGSCDSGYSCAYSRNISWAGPQTPMPKQTDPAIVFDRIFSGFDTTVTQAEIERRRTLRSSILDYVTEDANTLHGKLSHSDRLKLDEYLTGVRELENRIQAGAERECIPGDRPLSSTGFVERMEAMTDLMVLAMQCDLTRVTTFMLGNGGSNRTYSFLGVSGAHHELSHHGGNPSNTAALTTIGQWEVAQFANLVERMSTITEPDGTTLLENSLVYFSSECADGDSHSHRDLPVLLAGNGGGAHRAGRHLRYTDARMADLFTSMLEAADVDATGFGDANGPLPGLT